ncbi:hypothetical protein PIB30_000016 [Stylosanthes scabra]|uniref:Uncharacterized protein n=1 Tax=Stylosanthes scabra TaxID=79078 RepID=A0ABU6Q1U0_9FABA|nr:hypothetical protein [Stylosanthes scabra]
MVRTKKTTKRQRQEALAMEQPPQDHPMAKYFTNLANFNNYLIKFAPRKEITPRNNNHGVVTDNDLPILWAMVKDVEINWSYFITQHMKKLQEDPITSGLGYVILWTKIFTLMNVDVSNILEKSLKDTNCINMGTLHKMGRGGIAHEDQPQPQFQEAQDMLQDMPQEHIGSSYNAPQPSMLDLMQVLQRIEQNQGTMDQRFERFEEC